VKSKRKGRAKTYTASVRRETRERFIQLYACWERTHNSELIPQLYRRLNLLVKMEPQFDLRRQFEGAF